MSGRVEVHAPDGVGEVAEGDDLVALLLERTTVRDGDVVVVTSKVVSKAEGRIRAGNREESIAGETERVVARRGQTRIVRTHLGLTMAAAGIDASNVAAGHHLLLPADPDASARNLREAVRVRTGANVAVVVSDTAGRPWRNGQTDIAIGAAGLVVLQTFSGRADPYGNPLAVTEPAVADELAAAAELGGGKLAGRPFTVIRGRSDLVLPANEQGTGAAALVRADGQDMFGFGSREAVVAALAGRDRTVFGSPAAPDELAEAVREVAGSSAVEIVVDHVVSARIAVDAKRTLARLHALAFAFGWAVEEGPPDASGGIAVNFLPGLP